MNGAIPLLPVICSHGMDSDNYTFTFNVFSTYRNHCDLKGGKTQVLGCDFLFLPSFH